MMGASGRAGALFVTEVLILLLLFPAQPAQAIDCSVEDQVITQMKPKATLGKGDAGWLYVRDRDLGVNCSGSAAFSTVNIHNASFTRWVEGGWVEKWDCYTCNPRTKKWRGFMEGMSASGQGFGGFNQGWSIPGSDVGTWDKFRINNNAGTTLWNWWWAEDENGSYSEMQWAPGGFYDWDFGFSQSYVFGETGRYPAGTNSGTGAKDHFNNLEYKSSGWQGWEDNLDPMGGNYGYDNMDGWKWSHVGAREYEIVSCASPC
jgi:hypothetical protein